MGVVRTPYGFGEIGVCVLIESSVMIVALS